MAAVSTRFGELSPDEIQRLLDNATAKSTVKATKFGMKIFNDWLASPGGAKFPKPIEEMSKEELNTCLKCFYTSARKQDGSYYKASSLKSIRAAIDRHLRSAPHNKPFSVISDAAFTEANKVLGAFVKDLKMSGKIEDIVHKKAITKEQVRRLFDSGQLGPADSNDPAQLQRTAWFYVALFFGRRGRENQRLLKRDMLVLGKTPQGIEYYELNRQMPGSLPSAISSDDGEEESEAKIFAVPGSARCPVNTIKNYLSHLNPASDVLFQRPKDGQRTHFKPEDLVWYSLSPVGRTVLNSFMKYMSKRAGITPHLTNHCLRATSVAVQSRGIVKKVESPSDGEPTFEQLQQKSAQLSSFVGIDEAPLGVPLASSAPETAERVIGTMVEIEQQQQSSGEIVLQVRKFPVLLKNNQSVAVASIPAASNLAQASQAVAGSIHQAVASSQRPVPILPAASNLAQTSQVAQTASTLPKYNFYNCDVQIKRD
ncbi:hypothetical protein ACROYT_G004450 [Oculina patagonica]